MTVITVVITTVIILLTPHPGVLARQSRVLDPAAVNVSLLGDEGQSGDLGEGSLFVGVGNVDAGPLGHVLSVPGPGDVNGSRIEAGHEADQSVLLSQLDFISGVDHRTGGRN